MKAIIEFIVRKSSANRRISPQALRLGDALASAVRRGYEGPMKVELVVEGMHCDGCVRRVKALAGKVSGVSAPEVALTPDAGKPNMGRVAAEVADATAASALGEALTKAGYTVTSA